MMSRIAIAVFLVCCLASAAHAQLGPGLSDDFDPVFPLGCGSNANQNVSGCATYGTSMYTYLAGESAAERSEFGFKNFVYAGCLGATAAGLTHTPTACTAYNANVRATETGSITYPDNSTCWTVIDQNRTGSNAGLPNFGRVAGTHYLTDCIDANQPAMPADAQLLMKVTTSGGAITAVVDRRVLGGKLIANVNGVVNVFDYARVGGDLFDWTRAAIAAQCPTGFCTLDWTSGTSGTYVVSSAPLILTLPGLHIIRPSGMRIEFDGAATGAWANGMIQLTTANAGDPNSMSGISIVSPVGDEGAGFRNSEVAAGCTGPGFIAHPSSGSMAAILNATNHPINDVTIRGQIFCGGASHGGAVVDGVKISAGFGEYWHINQNKFYGDGGNPTPTVNPPTGWGVHVIAGAGGFDTDHLEVDNNTIVGWGGGIFTDGTGTSEESLAIRKNEIIGFSLGCIKIGLNIFAPYVTSNTCTAGYVPDGTAIYDIGGGTSGNPYVVANSADDINKLGSANVVQMEVGTSGNMRGAVIADNSLNGGAGETDPTFDSAIGLWVRGNCETCAVIGNSTSRNSQCGYNFVAPTGFEPSSFISNGSFVVNNNNGTGTFLAGGCTSASYVASCDTGGAAHGLNPGDIIYIQGVDTAGYNTSDNGSWTVATTPTPSTFTYNTLAPNLGIGGTGGWVTKVPNFCAGSLIPGYTTQNGQAAGNFKTMDASQPLTVDGAGTVVAGINGRGASSTQLQLTNTAAAGTNASLQFDATGHLNTSVASILAQIINPNGSTLFGRPFGPQTFYSAAGTAIPGCAAAYAHDFACVKDETSACTGGNTYASGGGNKCQVQCDGSNWKVNGVLCYGS